MDNNEEIVFTNQSQYTIPGLDAFFSKIELAMHDNHQEEVEPDSKELADLVAQFGKLGISTRRARTWLMATPELLAVLLYRAGTIMQCMEPEVAEQIGVNFMPLVVKDGATGHIVYGIAGFYPDVNDDIINFWSGAFLLPLAKEFENEVDFRAHCDGELAKLQVASTERLVTLDPQVFTQQFLSNVDNTMLLSELGDYDAQHRGLDRDDGSPYIATLRPVWYDSGEGFYLNERVSFRPELVTLETDHKLVH